MVQSLVAVGDSPETSDLVYDVLKEFFRGRSLDDLRPLLVDKRLEVVKAAIWIVSELGEKAAPLLDVIQPLLSHQAEFVRYFAIDSLLTITTVVDACVIAEIIQLADDPESSVRRKVLDFMSRASLEQIAAARSYFQLHSSDVSHAAGLEWLLNDTSADAHDVERMICSNDSTDRKYGVVAAVRMISLDNGPLITASASYDEDIRTFAADAIDVLRT